MAEHFAYFPHTEKDINEMLERISLSSCIAMSLLILYTKVNMTSLRL